MSSPTIVLITGANTGLGLETVKSLFRSSTPYTVLLGGRSLEKATAAAEAVAKEYPESKSKATPVQVDIEDDASITALKERVEKEFEKVDVLINNAGMFIVSCSSQSFICLVQDFKESTNAAYLARWPI